MMGHRVFPAVLAAISDLTAVGSLSLADAVGAPDRYCLQSSQSEYPGNCQFTSYFQCMASATGKDDRCRENPRYEYARKRHAR